METTKQAETNEQSMREICVYCDTTGLFTEAEIMKDNLTEIPFPDQIVRAWYDHCPHGYTTYEEWLDNYTADDTDGIYEFAVSQFGFTGSARGKKEDEIIKKFCIPAEEAGWTVRVDDVSNAPHVQITLSNADSQVDPFTISVEQLSDVQGALERFLQRWDKTREFHSDAVLSLVNLL